MTSRPATAAAATGASTPAIALIDVTFRYADVPVLRGFSLSVGQGEMVGLLGPNGSGKTTALRLLIGGLSPETGAVCIDGRPRRAAERRTLAKRIAIVPQEVQVTFDFRVEDLVLMGRGPHVNWLRGDTPRDRAIVRAVMHEVGIADLAERPFRQLSGGEKQQVALAMALAQEPEILLLDEPTHNLDIANQVGLFDLVQRLRAERRLTVLAVIHDVNLAALYCDRLILMRDGRVIAEGAPDAVVTPEHLLCCYGAAVESFPHPVTGQPQVALLPGHTRRRDR